MTVFIFSFSFAAKASDKPNLYFYGDSNTKGGKVTLSYPFQLGGFNYAIGGTTSADTLQMVSEGSARRDGYCFLMTGLNDIHRGTTTGRIVVNMLKIGELLKARGCNIYLLTYPEVPGVTQDEHKQLISLNSLIRRQYLKVIDTAEVFGNKDIEDDYHFGQTTQNQIAELIRNTLNGIN